MQSWGVEEHQLKRQLPFCCVTVPEDGGRDQNLPYLYKKNTSGCLSADRLINTVFMRAILFIMIRLSHF